MTTFDAESVMKLPAHHPLRVAYLRDMGQRNGLSLPAALRAEAAKGLVASQDARTGAGGVVVPSEPRKYRNVPTVVDGIRFDSQKESRRWGELLLSQRAGVISDLERQVSYALVVNGVKVATYIPDFRYRVAEGLVIEDCKGGNATKTPVYRMKYKLMQALYGITILET